MKKVIPFLICILAGTAAIAEDSYALSKLYEQKATVQVLDKEFGNPDYDFPKGNGPVQIELKDSIGFNVYIFTPKTPEDIAFARSIMQRRLDAIQTEITKAAQ